MSPPQKKHAHRGKGRGASQHTPTTTQQASIRRLLSLSTKLETLYLLLIPSGDPLPHRAAIRAISNAILNSSSMVRQLTQSTTLNPPPSGPSPAPALAVGAVHTLTPPHSHETNGRTTQEVVVRVVPERRPASLRRLLRAAVDATLQRREARKTACNDGPWLKRAGGR